MPFSSYFPVGRLEMYSGSIITRCVTLDKLFNFEYITSWNFITSSVKQE